MPDTIIMFEPDFRGHRMSFCAMIFKYCAASGKRVILASSNDTWSSEEYRLHFGDLPVEHLDLGALPAVRNISYLRWVRKRLAYVARVVPNSWILALEGDKLLPVLALSPRPTAERITVLMIRPPVISWPWRTSPMIQWVKQFSAGAAKARKYDVVALIPATEKSAAYTVAGWPATPDPIDLHATSEEVDLYRSHRLAPSDRIWFGVFGNVTRRKNLDLILVALADASPERVGLLVAGKVSAEEMARCRRAIDLFQERGGVVVFDNRLLTDEELDSAIGAADIAIIANDGQGPSQVMGKALASGTFVVAAGSFVLRDQLEKLGGGIWSDLDQHSLSRACGKAITEQPKAIRKTPLADGQEFVRSLVTWR